MLVLLSVLAKAASGHREEKLGGGCRTSAPGQDGAPWWKAGIGHRIVLASLRRKLSTSRDRSHMLLGQGLRSLLGRRSLLGGHGAVRLVLQGHTGLFLHRLNIWRGLSSFGSTMVSRCADRKPGLPALACTHL